MMEEGYYVPDISEFHKGFQYEIKYYDSENFEKKEFQGYFGRVIDILEGDNLQTEEVRVKYLDKTDIESLGWYFTKLHPGTSSHEFEFDKYNLDFDPHFNDKWNLRIYDGEDCDNEFNYFSGFVRNKSELSKLMKQLNISKE